MLNANPILATALEADPIVQIISAVGSSGILVWFMWFAISRVLPETRKEFTDTLKQISTDNANAHAEARKDFREELALERTLREKITEHCDARQMATEQRCSASHCSNFRYCPSGSETPPSDAAH